MTSSILPCSTLLGARERIVGLDRLVPLLDGTRVPYVNLDNAASTPPMVEVLQAVTDISAWYSSVHRGAGSPPARHRPRRRALPLPALPAPRAGRRCPD